MPKQKAEIANNLYFFFFIELIVMLSTIRAFHVDVPINIIRDIFLLCHRICDLTEEDDLNPD